MSEATDAMKKEEDLISEATDAVKKEDEVQTKENVILRLSGLLFAALNCIYLQSCDDIRLTVGHAGCDYGKYRDVLTEDERHGECVWGYMARGCTKEKPVQGTMDAKTFLVRDHRAASVHTQWLFAHLFFLNGNFSEAVKLADRASETMFRVASKIRDAALALAEKLEISADVLESDAAAEKALVVLKHDEQPAAIPRLPCDITRVAEKFKVQREHKDEARVAFEEIVIDIFTNGVCIAYNEFGQWDEISEVMLCATGLRKRYDEMTDEEKVSSGTVVLANILKDLASEDGVAAAIGASLVAARALEWNGRKLEEAVSKVRAAVV